MIPNEFPSTALLVTIALLVALSTIPAATAGLGATAQADELELTVDEQDTETFTVLVSTSAADVAGVDANVTFDPDVVTVQDVENLGFADPVVNTNNDDGWVFFTQARSNGVDAPTTAAITFEIQSEGTMTLEFVDDDTRISDSNHDLLSVTLSGTSTDVSPTEDTDGDDETDEQASDDNGQDTDGDRNGDASETDRSDDNGDYEQGEDDESGGDDSDAGDEETDEDATDESDDATDDDDDDTEDAGDFIIHFGVLMVLAGVILSIALLAYDRQ